MFNIANRIYLEYDYKFQSNGNYAVASEKWASRLLVSQLMSAPQQAPSFQQLLETEYNNSREEFWADLLSKTGKFVFYSDPNTLTELMVQYWRSIFVSDLTPEQVHFMYTTVVDSTRLRAYYYRIGAYNRETNTWSRPNALSEITFKTLEEITTIYNNNPPSAVLQNVDKTRVGVEYLLADFFADTESPYKTALMDRIKFLTWDNWLDELDHLKYELLSGNIDARKIDPTIDTRVGNIESELAKSEILKWTVDPLFNNDIEYIRQTYDYNIFTPCWLGLSDIWFAKSGGDYPPGTIFYDEMGDLNRLINTDQYEILLTRDIDRNYGCSYTRTRFLDKCNQVFSNYCYDRKRENQTADLTPFRLKR